MCLFFFFTWAPLVLGEYKFLILVYVAPVVSGLSAIFLAPLLALLLGRAVLVEVVELAAGEHKGAGPLAIRFLKGPKPTPSRRKG